jgi:hypothetical protein
MGAGVTYLGGARVSGNEADPLADGKASKGRGRVLRLMMGCRSSCVAMAD